jgi:cobyrinic acid a,c-diamide synthase
MAVVIAGERSGCGKTTITLALLAALKEAGESVQSFKVGPDYIDPMFHQFVTGRPCYNLDPVLTSEAYLLECFTRYTQTVSTAVVEGVMGLFDGAIEPPGQGSTAHLAKSLQLPILLVIDCRSISHSVAALVHGYRDLDPTLNFAGVILNRVGSDRQLEMLKTALEPLNIPILGVFRREDEISLPDRHLGLVPTAELPGLPKIVSKLAALGKHGFDWERLTPLLEVAHKPAQSLWEGEISHPPVRLAIAKDEAFSFYYAENLNILKALGAECISWSPLNDCEIPTDVQGFYFGGGFPEVFAERLAENKSVLSGLKQVISSGISTYAECGGLMYLSQAIIDFTGERYPTVGILPTDAVMGRNLTLGYRKAVAQGDTPLLKEVLGHEFHRSSLTTSSSKPLFQFNQSKKGSSKEGWYTQNLHASYIHLHWGATLALPTRWLENCSHSHQH